MTVPAGGATATTDPADWRRSVGAEGLLREFNEAGVIEAADVLVAQRLTGLAKETDESVALAVALVVRAVRGGSVCVDLTALPGQIGNPALPWPEAAAWTAAVSASPLTGDPPVLHLEDGLLYLDRYWIEECRVADDVLALAAARRAGPMPDVERLFPDSYAEQRAAARVALSRALTVLTGGPGTGKTTTVARLLALLAEQAEMAGKTRLRIALAAPTGKAAARLLEAVQIEVDKLEQADRDRLPELTATTMHRLLGSRPDTSSRFRHNRDNRLPHDVIVVDETSMVSLTMMARLLEAVRPDSRLVLVGDPDQLASVEAGAVLADLVDGLAAAPDSPIASLVTSHRFGASIGALASAIRDGDTDAAIEVLRLGGDHIEWVDTQQPGDTLRKVLVPHALRLREAAVLGDAGAALEILEQHRMLCAHRNGLYGVTYWNRQIERWLSEQTDMPLWSQWYVGRPVLVTANDYGLGLYNGDTGVAVLRDGALRAAMAGSGGATEIAPGRLSDIETMHAMTIHKSQGSQAAEVTVLLPPVDSRLLTRELLYTAVTRARSKVRLIGSPDQLRAAVERRAVRATGLSRRLGSPPR
ncbi:exodeoxyribonuclease V subunit alpha [Mycolicibacterium sp.]|uniref:exodeoxyribonuclease V subunit alpha n=1 Tax=Mycolicibacterium sp. TaxID=2320850 RepID=UPI0025F90E7A|nr:exodeoxyribonuclease V subunit alpha [Mycolicibacterium sp.]